MRRGPVISQTASPPSRSAGFVPRLITKANSQSPCKEVTTLPPKVAVGKSSVSEASLSSPPPKTLEESLEPMTTIQRECMTLMHFKQYKSSEAIARFELSTLLVEFQKVYNSSSEYFMDRRRSMLIAKKATIISTTLEIIADCCSFTDQTRRALHYYRQAIHYSRISSTYGVQNGGSNPMKLKNDRTVLTSVEANLRLKESECLSSMGKLTEALSILESSFRSHSSPYRTVAICMTLGNLYLATGKKADAIRAFMDALKHNPYTIEAIEKLAILNANRGDVLKVVGEGMENMTTATVVITKNQSRIQNKENRDMELVNRSSVSPRAPPTITERSRVQMAHGSETDTLVPMSQLVSAHFDSFSNNTKAAVNTFRNLDKIYPNNIYVLLNLAKLQLKTLDDNGAKETFEKIRSLDEFNLDGMDRFIALVASTPQLTKNKCHMGITDDYSLTLIHRISNDMLETNDSRAEPWLALAIYHRMNTDFVNALKFVDRAISCCPNYAYAHQLRGSILLSNRKPEQAIASFQRANDISCDMDSYEGLVESYLAAEKFREALFSAKEAINLSPKDPRAMNLVGLTLAYTSKDSNRSSNKQELEERAKRALKKGLELNPSAPRPLLKLLDLYLKSKEYDKGIEILMNAIDSEKDGIRGGTTNTWTALNVCHLQPLSYYGSGAAVRECKDILYTKLGVVHTLTKNYIEACKAFHMALSINPSNKEARRAYDRLETTMTGDECQFHGSDDELNNSWDQKDDNDSDGY
jgi:anaphase-promoting complex subunit 7